MLNRRGLRTEFVVSVQAVSFPPRSLDVGPWRKRSLYLDERQRWTLREGDE
jgi:hypothetical protein